MSSLARQLTVAAVAAVAGGAVAAPAGATTASPTPIKARTPLVAAITAQTPKIHLRYIISHDYVDREGYLRAGYFASGRAAAAVARVPADGAQLQAKLEWLLGVDMQRNGDVAVYDGEYDLVYRHPTAGNRLLSAGVADYRLSNYYVGQADAMLGISHPARTAEPYDPGRKNDTPAGPGTLRTPIGLTATITMATQALDEQLPSEIQTASVQTNEAAASYYTLTVSRMPVDAAQRSAQQQWIAGVRTQLRGDELLHRGSTTHGNGSPATGNREMRDALGILRTADSEIGHADELLGVHTSGPSVTLPSHVIYYEG